MRAGKRNGRVVFAREPRAHVRSCPPLLERHAGLETDPVESRLMAMSQTATESHTPSTASGAPPKRTTGVGVMDAVDRAVPFLLAAAIIGYVLIIYLTSKWFLDTLRTGYDPLVYVQPLWNSLHGHIAEQSALSYTTSAFGQDLFLFHFVLLPFFALHPATETLLFLQTVAAAAGAGAVYLIARDTLPTRKIVPFLFATLFLSYLPMQNVNLYEVQPRLFAATFLLFAFWSMTRGYALIFWICIMLALINRNDVALVIVALGIYGLLTRRKITYSWLPIIVGAVYWLLAVFVIIPWFAHGAQFSYLQNYDWLGDSASAMAKTIVNHPISVLRTAFGRDRWEYPVSLLFPLAFLPLLAPRVLIVAVPPFLLNIFAGPHYAYQRDIFHQYSAFISPWLFIAAIFAVASLTDGTHPLYRWLPALRNAVRRVTPMLLPLTLVLIMLGCSLIQQAYTRPSKVGDYLTRKEDPNRIASVDILIPMIPKDAPLAVTSLAATRVPLRRYLYEFPGNEFYDANLDHVEYILGDRRRGDEGQDLDKIRANGQWTLIKRQGDFELLQRIAPPVPPA